MVSGVYAESSAMSSALGWKWPALQQGRFVQSKSFANLPKPFTTRGYFLRQPGEFIWQTQQPVSQRMEIRDQRLFVEQGDGELVEQPLGASQVGLLEAMITADFLQLEAYFQLEIMPGEKCVELTPIDKELSDVVQQATLCGEHHLERIVLEHQEQMRTTIDLEWTALEAGES